MCFASGSVISCVISYSTVPDGPHASLLARTREVSALFEERACSGVREGGAPVRQAWRGGLSARGTQLVEEGQFKS